MRTPRPACWIAFILLWAFGSTDSENWPTLSDQADDAFRTQRDISESIPIDQMNSFGASLNRLIFDVEGYSSDALTLVLNLLTVEVSTILVDLYWNEFIQRWQLCPAPFPNNSTGNLTAVVEVTWEGQTYQCQPGFAPEDLMTTIGLYLRKSNVNLKANMVLIVFSLKSIYYETSRTSNLTVSTNTSIPSQYASTDAAYLLVSNSSLSYMMHPISSYLFTPLDFELYQDTYNTNSTDYPSQKVFLFTLFKRAISMVVDKGLHKSLLGYNTTSTDTDTLFFALDNNFLPAVQHTTNTTAITECEQLLNSTYNSTVFNWLSDNSHFRFAVDSDAAAFTNTTLRQYMECGFTAILNATEYNLTSAYEQSYVGEVIDHFLPYSFWSWAVDQPSDNSTLLTLGLDRRDDDDGSDADTDSDDLFVQVSDAQSAFQCVTMTTSGWVVDNCYNKYRVMCQKDSDPFTWTMSSDISTYFQASDRCPRGYSFGVPSLSVQQLALLNYLLSNELTHSVWIDVNDITIEGCFVTGGPYAECPYKKEVSTSSLLKRIAPSVVVAFVILVLIFFERIFYTTPIHSNRRRHWKKTINQFYKEHDYEGVPS